MGPDAVSEVAPIIRRRNANLWLAAVMSGVAAAAAVLFLSPPGATGLYPACPFHVYTGLLCPGCGGTRALAALVHGQFADAMRWNGLVVIGLAVCAGWAALAYARTMLGKERAWLRVPGGLAIAGAGCSIAFAIARNMV